MKLKPFKDQMKDVNPNFRCGPMRSRFYEEKGLFEECRNMINRHAHGMDERKKMSDKTRRALRYSISQGWVTPQGMPYIPMQELYSNGGTMLFVFDDVGDSVAQEAEAFCALAHATAITLRLIGSGEMRGVFSKIPEGHPAYSLPGRVKAWSADYYSDGRKIT